MGFHFTCCLLATSGCALRVDKIHLGFLPALVENILKEFKPNENFLGAFKLDLRMKKFIFCKSKLF